MEWVGWRRSARPGCLLDGRGDEAVEDLHSLGRGDVGIAERHECHETVVNDDERVVGVEGFPLALPGETDDVGVGESDGFDGVGARVFSGLGSVAGATGQGLFQPGDDLYGAGGTDGSCALDDLGTPVELEPSIEGCCGPVRFEIDTADGVAESASDRPAGLSRAAGNLGGAQ